MRTHHYILAIGIFGSVLIGLLYFGVLRFNYPSHEKYPIRGLDISHHQGEIDWQLIDIVDYKFIYIKATEGQDYQDPRFLDNWEQADKYGFDIGAYHFFRLCTPGDKQADNLIKTVPKKDGAIPCVIDLEFGGNCKIGYSKEELIEHITYFMDTVTAYFDTKPIIYTTLEFYKEYLIDNFSDYHIWIRDVFKKPKLQNDREWIFWQFTNRGRVNGIDGYVDINVFNGDETQYRRNIYAY